MNRQKTSYITEYYWYCFIWRVMNYLTICDAPCIINASSSGRITYLFRFNLANLYGGGCFKLAAMRNWYIFYEAMPCEVTELTVFAMCVSSAWWLAKVGDGFCFSADPAKKIIAKTEWKILFLDMNYLCSWSWARHRGLWRLEFILY